MTGAQYPRHGVLESGWTGGTAPPSTAARAADTWQDLERTIINPSGYGSLSGGAHDTSPLLMNSCRKGKGKKR